jgi:hypothetical protein
MIGILLEFNLKGKKTADETSVMIERFAFRAGLTFDQAGSLMFFADNFDQLGEFIKRVYRSKIVSKRIKKKFYVDTETDRNLPVRFTIDLDA